MISYVDIDKTMKERPNILLSGSTPETLLAYFPNDNDVVIKLSLNGSKSQGFLNRGTNHEVMFRRIHTCLMNNNIIPVNKNIIDLGAWIGDNSIPWAKNIRGIVYAIDPSPSNIDFISETCLLNDIKNVKCITTAISNKNEILSTNDDIDHCSFVYDKDENGKTEQKAVSLDYLYETNVIENIGYIHLDVEGMEHQVLQGSENIIDKYNPIISFEQLLDREDYTIVSNYLKNKSYKVFMINEIPVGCGNYCRNFIAFHDSIFSEELIKNINLTCIIPKTVRLAIPGSESLIQT
tara:strand:+ start:9291 stop:10169 length:879 start_codon:yes stop_codon:yes gene_type:complete